MDYNKNNSIVVFIIVALYVLRELLPIVTGYSSTPVNIFCVVFIWVFSFVVLGVNTFNVIIRSLPIFLATILTILFVKESGGGFATTSYSLMQLLIWPVLASIVIDTMDASAVKYMAYVIIAGFMITAVTTIIGCVEFPEAARIQAQGIQTNSDDYYLYRRLNIGGFEYIYSLVLMIPLFLFLLKNKDSRLINAVFIIVSLICIYYSQYTTAFVCAISCFILLFIKSDTSKKKLAYTLVFLAILFIMCGQYVSSFFMWLSQSVEGDALGTRLSELSTVVGGGDASTTDDYSIRNDMWMRSWNTFTEHPIFGSTNPQGIGGHSYILDNLASFGIMGLVSVVLFFSTTYKFYIKQFENAGIYLYLFFAFFLQIVMAFANPEVFVFYFTLVLPIFSRVFFHSEEN